MQEAGQVIPLASPPFSPAPFSPPSSPGPTQSSRSSHTAQRRPRSRKSTLIPPARSMEIDYSESPVSLGDGSLNKFERGKNFLLYLRISV